jgi:hypothetical protein
MVAIINLIPIIKNGSAPASAIFARTGENPHIAAAKIANITPTFSFSMF